MIALYWWSLSITKNSRAFRARFIVSEFLNCWPSVEVMPAFLWSLEYCSLSLILKWSWKTFHVLVYQDFLAKIINLHGNRDNIVADGSLGAVVHYHDCLVMIMLRSWQDHGKIGMASIIGDNQMSKPLFLIF